MRIGLSCLVAVLLGVWMLPAPLASRASAGIAGGTIHGVVMGVNGQPAAGVKVKLVPHLRRHAEHLNARTTTTDPTGHFEFDGVAPGQYVIEAGGKGVGHGRTTIAMGPGNTVNVSVGLGGHYHRRRRT